MKEIDKLAWLFIKNKQLLGARSKNKSICYIPGGKREIGESDENALIREIKEELSIDLLPHTIKYVGVFKAQAHDKSDGTLVKLTCYYAEFIGEIKPNAEVEEVMWLSDEDKAKCSAVTQVVLHWLKTEGMIK